MTPRGTATSTPDPEQQANERRAIHLAVSAPYCEYSPDPEAPEHLATVMVRLEGSDSLDAVSFTCHEHAPNAITNLTEFGEVGDAIEVLKFDNPQPTEESTS